MKQLFYLLFFAAGLIACSSNQDTAKTISKTDMAAKWGVESISGLENPSTGLVLNLDLLDNTIQGFGGCNNFQGDVERNGFNIKFNHLLSTKKMCPHMKVEDTYLDALSKVTRFGIDKNILTFYDENGKKLITLVKMSR